MPDEDDDDMLGNEPATVPYHRFREVAQKRRALNAELDKLRAEYAKAAEAAKELEAVRSQVSAFDAERAKWSDERAMISAGLTDEEGIAVAQAAYARVAEAARPKGGIGEWLKDKDKLPKGVRAYLAAEDKPADKAPPVQPAAKAQAPASDRAARQVAGTPAPLPRPSALTSEGYTDARASIWEALGQKAPDYTGLLGAKK